MTPLQQGTSFEAKKTTFRQFQCSKPPFFSWEILYQVDDDLGIIEEKDPSIDPHLAKKIENVFFEISRDNAKLQKIMRDHKHLLNLNKLKPPKIKPDIESLQQSQNNTTFVMTNEKGLYSSQNFVIKAISIVSNMADSALASDDDKGGFLDHVNLVKSHLSTIAFLSHVSAEPSRKRKNNLRNIVHADFLALCGPHQQKQNQITSNQSFS